MRPNTIVQQEMNQEERAIQESIFLAKDTIKQMLSELVGNNPTNPSCVKIVVEVANTDPEIAQLALAVSHNDVSAAIEFILGNGDPLMRHPFVPVL